VRPDVETRFSWICPNEFERTRFIDLHRRLLRANSAILGMLVVLIAVALPFVTGLFALLPAAAGMVLFGAVQLYATRFARPELWVFSALLGAEGMIVFAVAISGGALTPAMALLCWPVMGMVGRFPHRVARLGTLHALVLAAGTILVADPGILTTNPLSLTLLLAALVSVHAVGTVLRDSDVENRSAAILDPLTGMLNRAALATRTPEIELQSGLTGEPVAVVVADLDHFKEINDTHGHPVGDAVLQEVGYRLRKELRAYDLAYRIGGEEFVILLLGGTESATTATAHQLREAVAAEPIAGLAITISLGIAASRPGSSFDWEDVFARADAALYRAKADGRNRVAADHGARELALVPA